jgi:hypothetical protein
VSLDVLQPYGPPWPVMGIALLYHVTLLFINYFYKLIIITFCHNFLFVILSHLVLSASVAVSHISSERKKLMLSKRRQMTTPSSLLIFIGY